MPGDAASLSSLASATKAIVRQTAPTTAATTPPVASSIWGRNRLFTPMERG
jgi:hypothetical protein